MGEPALGAIGGFVPLETPASAPAFALEPIRPNPVLARDLFVRFALASAMPASLELIDISGRRVARQEIGHLGPGRHGVRLAEDRILSPGICLVRLRQGQDVRSTRVAILR